MGWEEMKVMNIKTYSDIEKWVMQHGRLLEINLWNYFFNNGTQEDVLNVLMLYQNEDGGFGHALEPDNWNINSTPSSTLFALNILRSIDYFHIEHTLYQGIIKYLSSGKDRKDYGWRFNTPSNDDYPHAPWWNYDEEANTIESTGLTAEFTAFILKYVECNTELYQTAIFLAKKLVDNMMKEDKHGDMGVCGFISLVETMTELNLDDFDYKAINTRLSMLVTKGIEHDVNKWKYYGYRPSNYISSQNSKFYEPNKDIVNIELDYLIETIPEQDIWPITWTWFDNNEKYPKEFAISEVWWKSIKAIEKMRFLNAFERLCC